MSERKKIDQLFQEKFQDFEVTPPEIVWSTIEERLKEKKKRRVIPFWWWTSGVAALFVIGLFIWNSNDDVVINPNNNVVIDSKNDTSNEKDNTISVEKKNSEINSSLEKSKETQVTEDAIVATDSDLKTKENLNSEKDKEQNPTGKSSRKTKRSINSFEKNVSDEATVANHNKHKQKIKNTGTEAFVNQNSERNSNNSLAENKITEDEKIIKNNFNSPEKQNELKTENNISIDKIAMKNQEDIAIKGENNAAKDSTAIATVETNKLEELLNEKEKQIAKEQKLNRWQVTPNLAPIYFGSFSDGSPLDENLDENTKAYNTNLSYGVAVNYAVNKKIKVRTGINAFTVDYNTNDIVFFQNSNARMMKNVEPTLQGSLIEIIPIKNLNTTSFNKLQTEQNDGVLNQRMGFIELPLELSYKVVDSKFGIEILGGMSTMFLSNNEVFLEADGMRMKLGEATNLNTVHFSTNLGLGLNYKFYKQFQARIEPTFKYQINTFSRDSENFKPYIIGIYSGISYSF
ncbi:outer membrane beta-barrel protein [Flavobacterium dankookense]|uniref:Outer membrane protein with beta-barrel domain n=1 Tax=Flavobacterium dankookense TaxID=706186 RepID=A0A4R6QCI6_9FLAO|nr:outer membrane beta-barrel protein [Flavobacterium dankookense]TDP59980.1 outer membrane protein with beta-barrel domain [Flavobacterium dankookense]